MDENTRRTRRRILTVIDFIVLGALVGYMIYSGFVVKQINNTYRIVIGVGIFLFWLIENVIAPIVTDEFADKTPEQINTYKKMAALSLVGYMGLVYFVAAMNHNTGIYGAVAYVVTVMIKRRLSDEYYGRTSKEESDPEEADAVEDGADAALAADADTPELIDDPLSQDASTRLQRQQNAEQEEEEHAAPANMLERVRRLNELSEEIEETQDE